MAKAGLIFLGGFVGAIVGIGLIILSIFLGSTFDSLWLFIPLSIVGWLIGGFVAGLIASGPGRGALAGLFVSIFSFIINALIVVFVVILGGLALFTVILELLTLGMYDSSSLPTELVAALIFIGLLIAFIFTAISAFFNIIAGTIGGLIRNPARKQIVPPPEPLKEEYR